MWLLLDIVENNVHSTNSSFAGKLKRIYASFCKILLSEIYEIIFIVLFDIPGD